MIKLKIEKVILRKLFLLILLILAILGVSEILARIFFDVTNRDIRLFRPSFYYETGDEPFKKLRYKSHPFLPYTPQPNDKRIITVFKPDINRVLSYEIQNNSLGFRTPERPFAKGANIKRIVVLGGSTAWDGPTNEKTWPALLEKKLNDFYEKSGRRSEVINLAIDGAPSAMSLTILNLIGVFYEPDLVISFDGVNDLSLSRWEKVIPDYSNRIKPFNENIFLLQTAIPRWLYKSYLVSVITNRLGPFLGQSIDIYSYVNEYNDGRATDLNSTEDGLSLYLRNLRLMRAACWEYDCKFVATIPHWVEVNSDLLFFDSEVRGFLERENINYLDLQSQLPHNDFSIHSDKVHWTEKGLNLVADIWFNKILSEKLLGI